MRVPEPWQTAEIPGPIKAFVITEPSRVASMLKASKRPLFIVGNRFDEKALEGGVVSSIVEIARAIGAYIAVYGPLYKRMKDSNYDKIMLVPSMEVLDRVRDSNWKGFDGEGGYDLVVFLGFPYYFQWLMLSGMKHYADRGIRTLSLDPYYHPNATISLNNMDIDKWLKFVSDLKSILTGGD